MQTMTESPEKATPVRGGVRTDIQGLRAVAVSSVVIYHLLPKGLTGGFAGVDVFFVISGFLITSHLLEARPRNLHDLGTFWSRRVRRLLPASLLVLATTLVMSRLIAPETQWANTARQARGAALYVVNWMLARDSVDYLAAENAPSPVQHFWSLSVEEQFYFVWPIAICLLILLARRTRLSEHATVTAGLALVVTGSLAYSVHETATNPASAYFVTPTRIWELGVGGLLAAAALWWPSTTTGRLAPVRAIAAWAGLGGILLTALTYTGKTPFPGWQAALPVLSTALVIAANPGRGDRWSPGRLLAVRPMQWLGDISYSVYLWHWPMVALVPAISHGSMGNLDRLAIVITTLVLAALTKKYVEDRFRTAPKGQPLRRTFLAGAIGMAVVVGLAGLQLAEVAHRDHVAAAALQKALTGNDPCFGARALERPGKCPAVNTADALPALINAADDKADVYLDVNGHEDCWSYLTRFPQVNCTRGDKAGKVTVAVVGNSHAGEWMPAVEAVAKARHWKIRTYLASRCAMSDTPQQFDTQAQTDACQRWVRRTAKAVVRARPSLVLLSNRISAPAQGKTFQDSQQPYGEGYTSVLKTWKAAGLKVLVLHDTPAPGVSIPDCLAEHTDDATACNGTRAAWVPQEPAAKSVRDLADPDIRFLDLTDHICGPVRCTAITGGVITYFDASHLTATFAGTLAPYLGPPMARLLDR